MWPPFTRRDNCHGQELGRACSPPTMRDPAGFLPHPVKQEFKSYIFQVILKSLKDQTMESCFHAIACRTFLFHVTV